MISGTERPAFLTISASVEMTGHLRRSCRTLDTLLLPVPRSPITTMFISPAPPRRAGTRPFPCAEVPFQDGPHDAGGSRLTGPQFELSDGLMQKHLEAAHGAAP